MELKKGPTTAPLLVSAATSPGVYAAFAAIDSDCGQETPTSVRVPPDWRSAVGACEGVLCLMSPSDRDTLILGAESEAARYVASVPRGEPTRRLLLLARSLADAYFRDWPPRSRPRRVRPTLYERVCGSAEPER